MNLAKNDDQARLVRMVRGYLARLEKERGKIDSRNLAALAEYERRIKIAGEVLATIEAQGAEGSEG